MIDDQQALDLIHQLVAIPSVSTHEENAVGFLTEFMGRHGFDAKVDEVGNAVAVRENPDGNGQIHNELMLLGHIDTVSGEVPVRLENGRLYGRGSVDAKGPLAAFAVAAVRSQVPEGTRIIVVGAVEEEVTSSKGARHVAERYGPHACIIGEPSRWDAVTLGYKGVVRIKVRGRQDCGHSAGPETQIAERAIQWWNGLATYADQLNQSSTALFDQLLLSLSDFNTLSDGLTSSVTLEVGARLPPSHDHDEFKKQIESSLPEGMTVEYAGWVPAYQTKRTTNLARLFGRSILQNQGKPGYKRKTGTSDMNVVGPAWGCPMVAYGPGDSSLDHTPNEHLELDDYLNSIRVLQGVIENFSGSESRPASHLAKSS